MFKLAFALLRLLLKRGYSPPHGTLRARHYLDHVEHGVDEEQPLADDDAIAPRLLVRNQRKPPCRWRNLHAINPNVTGTIPMSHCPKEERRVAPKQLEGAPDSSFLNLNCMFKGLTWHRRIRNQGQCTATDR